MRRRYAFTVPGETGAYTFFCAIPMKSMAPDLIDQVRSLLEGAIREVFATMLDLEIVPVETGAPSWGAETVIAGSVGFNGQANGVVYLNVTASFGRTLAGRMFGLDESDLENDEMVNDVVGELTNMIVGSVKSRLCDAGARCVLTVPSIVRGRGLTVEPVSSLERRMLFFDCGGRQVLLELLMKQPAQAGRIPESI